MAWGISRLWSSVVVATVVAPLAMSCAADSRAPFAEECVDDPLCSGAGDGGPVGGGNNTSTGTGPTSLECLSQAELERRTEMYDLTPMTGMPELFLDGRFSFMDTTRLRDPAKIITKAHGGGGLACTEWDTQVPFLLHGVEKPKTGGGGPVLIEPLQEGDFVPTVLERVARSGNSPYLPVFPIALIDQIFEDIGIERRLDRAQILTLVASGTDPTGRPFPQPGVVVKSTAAQTVAFKQGATWTTDREDTATNGDGLALLVNVNGYPTVEGTAHVTFEGSIEDEFDLMASDGAVTYAVVVASSGP
jgi:hypothetical protein